MTRSWPGLCLFAGIVLASCGLGQHQAPPDPKPDEPAVSADQLGDAFQDDATAEFLGLDPKEREALRREQTHLAEEGPARPAEPAPPQGRVSRALDDVGKVGIALLSVGATLGAFVAPFFLF